MPDHSMNPSLFQHIAAFLLFPVLLAGCAVKSALMPKTGTLMGSTGDGKVGESWWTGDKCQAILDWIEPFKQEYPNLDLTGGATSRFTIAQTANLFRDSVFVPVFGFEYNTYNSGKMAEINRTVMAACMGWGQHANRYYKDIFGPLKPFFDATFGMRNPALAALVRDYNQREEWVKTARQKMDEAPETREGFQKLDQEVFRPAEQMVKPLTPGEQEEFFEEMKKRQQERAAAIVEKYEPVVSRNPDAGPTPEEAQLYANILQDGEGSQAERMAETLTQRLERQIEERLAALQTIPMTVEGRRQCTQWLIDFSREFKPYEENRRVIQAKWDWARHREAIYKATKGDFLEKLDKLPTGKGSEIDHEKLMEETFPFSFDKNTIAYSEYRRAAEDHQHSFLRRMFDKTVEGVKNVGKTISKGARNAVDAVRGGEAEARSP